MTDDHDHDHDHDEDEVPNEDEIDDVDKIVHHFHHEISDRAIKALSLVARSIMEDHRKKGCCEPVEFGAYEMAVAHVIVNDAASFIAANEASNGERESITIANLMDLVCHGVCEGYLADEKRRERASESGETH